jgi:uncharacterized membrane protein
LHQWLVLWEPSTFSLAWKLRSLSAFFGVAAIAAIYFLNRIAFSKSAGLMAAALMAVSPFAVYLSQEARHYTIPMFIVSVTLLASLEMVQDLQLCQSKRWWIWMGWVLLHGIGLYVHYFAVLVIAAQIGTFLFFWLRKKIPKQNWQKSLQIGSILLLPFVIFLPWFGTLWEHIHRSETNWLQPFDPNWVDSIAPIYQTLLAWFSMTIALPVERQPLAVIITCALITLLFVGWLIQQAIAAYQIIDRASPSQKDNNFNFIAIFTLVVLLEFAFIVYVLKKDITVAPRYHFIYYPSVCALLGYLLATKSLYILSQYNLVSSYFYKIKPKMTAILPIFFGTLSSIFVIQDMVFQKPYYPQEVAQKIEQTNQMEIVTIGYQNLQEVALGLSFINAMHENFPKSEPLPRFAFFSRSNSYQPIWQKLKTLSGTKFLQNYDVSVYLWGIAPGLKRAAYPQTLQLGNYYFCSQDPKDYFRLGIPFQGYPCQKTNGK